MEMLTFVLETDSRQPLYQQLYTHIKKEIQEGNIKPGTKLPSKRKLSTYLNLSQNTVQAAYIQLIEEGYISSVERKGFYVSDIIPIKTNTRDKKPTILKKSTKDRSILYDFSIHGVDFSSFPFSTWRKLMREVINEYDKELLIPCDSFGYYRLRHALASYLYHSRGVICNENQIIISSGTEYLFQILFQLFKDDTIYGIENPGYEKLNQMFNANRAKFTTIDIDKDGMPLSQVYKSGANILCITPAHQFPTGEIMPIKRRMQLLDWAKEQKNRYIVEDDYDSEFKYSGKPIPALQGLDHNEKVIYMGSFSKSLSPTIRLSYMVLPQHLLNIYKEDLSYILCPVPMMDQKILCRFIEEGYFERHLNKMRSIYRKKRELLIKSIRQLDCDIEILGADAGLHLLIKVNNNMSESQLIEEAYKAGVKVYGISKYYTKPLLDKSPPLIILGYATLTDNEIIKAVKLLHNAWF
ncbi:MAG: PLP-dependent aminotransferase family protein [Clostridiales bacterium]|nr:PLP-dependent aminotransferase family protein [Clostridiales bacterium]